MQKITPFLWYEKEASEAAKFYTSVFPDSKIIRKETFSDTPSGQVEVVSIELMGQEFTLMSAGPLAKFNESISFVINCESQEEVDHYWNKLTTNGGQESMCGWLKDKYGVSWQVVPTQMSKLLQEDKSGRVMKAMLQMKKIDIEALKQASEKQ